MMIPPLQDTSLSTLQGLTLGSHTQTSTCTHRWPEMPKKGGCVPAFQLSLFSSLEWSPFYFSQPALVRLQ